MVHQTRCSLTCQCSALLSLRHTRGARQVLPVAARSSCSSRSSAHRIGRLSMVRQASSCCRGSGAAVPFSRFCKHQRKIGKCTLPRVCPLVEFADSTHHHFSATFQMQLLEACFMLLSRVLPFCSVTSSTRHSRISVSSDAGRRMRRKRQLPHGVARCHRAPHSSNRYPDRTMHASSSRHAWSYALEQGLLSG